MINEWKDFPNCRQLVKKINVPIKFICAEKGILVKGCNDYYQNANHPKDFVV